MALPQEDSGNNYDIAANDDVFSTADVIQMRKDVELTQSLFYSGYEYTPKEFKIDNAYNQVLYAPDIHTATISLENAIDQFQQEANGKTNVVVLGDTNDRREHLGGLYQTFQLPTPDQVELNYLAQKMDLEDVQNYAFVHQIEKKYGGDLEELIYMQKAMGNTIQADDLRKQYSTALDYVEQNNVRQRVEDLLESEQDEIKKAESEVKRLGVTMDFTNAQYIAQEKAKVLYDANIRAHENGWGATMVIEEGGNHGSLSDTHLFRQEYNKLVEGSNLQKADEVIYNAMEIHGSIDLGSGEDKFSFQIANHCPGNFPGLVGMIYNPIEQQLMFQQCFDNTYVTRDQFKELEGKVDLSDIFSQSIDAQRMAGLMLGYEIGEQRVDKIFLHDERGDVVGYNINNDNRVIHLGLEAYIETNVEKDEEGDITAHSGHWHKGTGGIVVDKEFKQKKSRAFMAKIGKDSYQEYDTPVENLTVDLEKFQKMLFGNWEMVQQRYELISNQVEAANDDQTSLEDKAA